jgi:hypothetical protein
VRQPVSFVVGAALAIAALHARSARADDSRPDAGPAILTGAAAFVAGFVAGGVVVARADGQNTQSNIGWLTIESGFALAPLAAHAVSGEWLRGLALTAPPLAMIGGTSALFAYDPGTILHGSLEEQRVMWSFFVAGLASGVFGVIDVAIPRGHSGPAAALAGLTLAPSVAPGRFGLEVAGTL